MALIVQKFGGSSVGDIERIRHVANIVQKTRAQGHQVVVVVSAMQGETDRLIQLARQTSSTPNAREYDALISTGEQVTTALLSMTLIEQKIPARSYSAGQVLIRTDSEFKKANILKIETDLLFADIQKGIVPVIAGFQGIDAERNITTLGRGGSDMSGVAVASALNADECQIYTDVEGVFTTDPRVVKGARKLDEITFEEMLELSELGAKVLQIRSVEYANKHNVPLRVLSTFTEGTGTLITHVKREDPVVSGIAFHRNQAKLTIRGLPNHSDYVGQILQSMQAAKVEVDMMVQNAPSSDNRIDFSFIVPGDDYSQSLDITHRMAKTFRAETVVGHEHMAKLSLVGVGIQSHAGFASTMFQVLAKEEIPIHLITATEIKISVIIDDQFTEHGVQALHSAFGLEG